MGMKDVFKRYLVFVIGLYFLAAGIVLIVRSALGTTPISSVNYVLSLNSPLSLGTCTFLINMLLILGQFWVIRKNKTRQDTIEILLQLPFSFIFSAFIDFNMALTSNLHPDNYGMSIALLLTGCMIQSIGVVLELKPKVAMMSAGDGEYAVTGRSGGSRRSVREAIELATPVEGIITDRFDIRNGNFGIRIAAAASDRIAAVDNGTVVLSLWTPETGYMVELQHAGNLLSVYKGLSQSLVTKGQTIRAGELIGYNAEAEQGEGRLFEFELWNNGKPVDPEGYIVFQ